MKRILTSELFLNKDNRPNKLGNYYKALPLKFLQILFFYIYTFLIFYPQQGFAQSEGVLKALDTYKNNFYVWQEPEANQQTEDSILTVLGRWAWGPCNTADAKGNIAYIGNGPTFHILDISEPASPEIIGEYLTDGYIYEIEVRDNVAFVCVGSGLLILDVSDPSFPGVISFIEISGVAISFALEGSFVYLTTFSGYMKVVDISNLNSPFPRGIIPTLAELAGCVEAKDGYVYIGSPELPYMQIVDANNPDSLDESFFNSDGAGISSFIKDTLLFVGSSWYSTYLKIYNISNLQEPEFIGHVEIEDSILINGITVSEDGLTAYALCLTSATTTFTTGIYSIDISYLNQPVILDKFNRTTQASARGISLTQNTLVASYYSGLCVLDISDPNLLQFHSFFPTGGFAEKIQIKDSLAFVASGLSGLWILDVSDPYKPKSISNVNTRSFTSDLVVEDTLVYIVNWPVYLESDTSRGLWIIDVSKINQPEIISHYIGITKYSYVIIPNSITKSGNLILITQAFTATDNDIMEIIDISNPTKPIELGVYQNNYHALDIIVNDSIAYLSTADYGLRILNISDPANPTEISNILNSSGGVIFENPYVYTSTSDFAIINVDNPFNPFVISSINTHNSTSGNVDLAILGDYAFWAEYNLGIVNISNPENPIQISTFLGKDIGRGVDAASDKVFFADRTMGIWVLENKLISSIEENKSDIIPNKVELYQNYPNPFNAATAIEFSLPQKSYVKIEIFDLLGRRIQTLIDEEVEEGKHKIKFDPSNLTSGIYFYRLTARNQSITKKMVTLK